ncbi:prophage protein [Lactobacillus amylovorus]|uniref:Prophage protein n=1 Tax=Lactobacillus amylovorus TaxID=1604 RepID=F0TFC5_LACAM|nr:GDSL-type esterase/lipase family protein [Lactobacillus amylovorus]ADZ07419.1 prophage protein [Lactobacillus amylovorus]
MVDDQIKVTHDNNGRFYRIKMDLAKEGSEIWDLTPYFKGRVGDNRFGLQVVWTYQGRLLDTTGMKPYIEGNVGNYSFDDKKDLQLAPDAATVCYTGNPSDCQAGGQATYYFPEQMFPRDGIFKGYIGLLDDRDDSSQPHISGVTVWFRVLPGIAQMGHACDVYISDLDKALQNFKVKLDQHDKDYQTQLQQVIDDARNAYENETKNSHDAALAANAELSKLREDITKASHSIGDVQNQIDADNIVTTNDFKTVTDETKNLINDRLKNISLAPQAFASLDDLKQKYPSGADGLFRVGNEGYIWENNAWTSTGEIASTMISDADFNQRLGSFMFFDNGKDTSATVTDQEVDSTTKKHAVKLTITAGTLIYLANGGFFKSPSPTNLEVTGTYLLQDVFSKGMLTLYFDNASKLYFAYAPERRNDLKLFSVYCGKLYGGLNIKNVYVNGIADGGWGHLNRQGYAMYLPLWNNQPIRVTFNTVLTDGKYQNTYQVVVPDNVSYAMLDGKKGTLKPATLNITTETYNMPCLFTDAKGNPYLDYQGHSSDDVLLAALFNKFAYGVNVQNIVVNGIDNGGFGNNSKPGYAMYLPLWNNQPIRVTFNTVLTDGKYQNTYQVVVPDNVSYAMLDGKKGTLKPATLNITTETYDMPCLFTDAKGNPYLDYQGHSSDDVLLAALFNKFAYGVNVQNIVVNGITNGGFGDFEHSYDLNDWRIKAENKESANIAWLGDSTFQGYKTSSPDHIAGNYLNKLLLNDYIGVTSYVCAIGGYTTQNMYDHFDDLLKLNNAKDIGLVLIGGGLNDSGNITDEAKYLDLIIKKVRMIGATPVIVTTQATALLNTNHDQGDDWTGKLNSDFAKTNQIRREYAKIHNIDLIDLEKYQNDYVEYGPAKLNEMFDDYLHGHDDMHKFGAEFIFSELAADYVDIIKKPKVISVTTMKAKSDLMAHKTNFELTDSSLNRKGFKASMKRTDVTSDQIVIDYQFFIPASEEQYYLNGYNLGDPVNVSLNGDITQLTGTQKVATLEPGYYHVIVKPTTANINFAGLRIETDNLTESTVQPASGTTPATSQPTTPQAQPNQGNS